MVISRSREDARKLHGKLRFGNDTIPLQDSLDILSVKVDLGLQSESHLEKVVSKAYQNVTLRCRMKHLLNADGLMTLYKTQRRPVMEYAPLTWMPSARTHLNLLNKVQRRSERLISGTHNQQPRQRQRQQRQQHQQLQQRTEPATNMIYNLEHRRKVAALTVLH